MIYKSNNPAMNISKKILVIGNGKTIRDILKIIQRYNKQAPEIYCNCAIVTDTKNSFIGSNSNAYLRKMNILNIESDNINSLETIKEINKFVPDIIISANNHQIIGKEIFKVSKSGIVNFHNAPLPRYAGLNACSWAIINGEKEHGVTWHYLDEKIDSGDIISQRFFPIGKDTTAIELIMRCIEEGMILFKELLPNLLRGNIDRTPQDISKRLFYRKNQLPNKGFVDFNWKYEKFYNFIRGLNFYPLPSIFAKPTAFYRKKRFFINSIKLIKRTPIGLPGEIVHIDQSSIYVALSDSTIAITEISTSSQKTINLSRFIEENDMRLNTLLT
jgi:methionyl-tRNA formyltransferase